MTRKERIMAAAQRKPASEIDTLPFFHYWRYGKNGWAERECRNRGMGFCWIRPCYTEVLRDVEITEQQTVSNGTKVIRRTFKTPVGSLYVDEKRDPGVGHWHAQRSWNAILPWETKRLIQNPEDYKVAKFIAEHTEYQPDYYPIEQAKEWLGDDGVVLSWLPHSPMQTLMINWIGSEEGRFFYHHVDYPDLVEDLYQSIWEARKPLHEIAANSPAEVVLCGDNIDGFLVNPNLFKQYFMPVYEEQGAKLHSNGKLMAIHMDGRLKMLKDLIGQTPVDIVEAFHPPPMGDLPVSEALEAWPDKSIWIGFPGTVYELGPKATKQYTEELLQDLGDGSRIVIESSTENLISNENLVALTDVLERASLPLKIAIR